MKVTILGAGVLGLAVATELADRGLRPRLIDPAGGPGPHGCSWWAGGMLAPHCEGESAEPAVVRLGLDAAAWWQAHGAHVTPGGTLVVATGRDGAELDRLARLTEGHRALDGPGVAALEPALGGRVRRGIFFADEGHLDPRQALGALVSGLAARGIAVEPVPPGPVPPGPVPPGPDNPGVIVDARGLAARDALADLRGVRGEMMVLRCPEVRIGRTIRLLHPRIPIYLVPRGEGIYMLGATMLESGDRGPVTARAAVELLGAAYALHPAFAEAAILELGADARPAFPDNLPRLRRRGDRLFVNGLYRHGYLLAPAVARMAADHLIDGKTPEFMDEDHP